MIGQCIFEPVPHYATLMRATLAALADPICLLRPGLALVGDASLTHPTGAYAPYACWWVIKTMFLKFLPTGERGIWQRPYWEHTIRDERDYAAHMDDTHFNLVKHGFVEHPADWPFSSFRPSVKRGVYPVAWRHGSDEATGTGER